MKIVELRDYLKYQYLGLQTIPMLPVIKRIPHGNPKIATIIEMKEGAMRFLTTSSTYDQFIERHVDGGQWILVAFTSVEERTAWFFGKERKGVIII